MKPIYDPYMMRWKVKGLGWFDSRAEASAEIKKLGHDTNLIIRIKSELKQKIETLAQKRNTTVSELVRELIEKELEI